VLPTLLSNILLQLDALLTFVVLCIHTAQDWKTLINLCNPCVSPGPELPAMADFFGLIDI